MVNLLGTGADRDARLGGRRRDALGDPGAHVHVYGKRRVFERRKMGHVTVVGTDADEALERARRGARGAALGGLTSDVTEAGATGPVVGIVGGSRSDFPVLEKATTVLDALGVPCELRVVSRPSHARPPVPLRRDGAPARGIRVIIAGAGGAAHLPGMLAAKTTLPVIGVPIPTQHLGGLDSLLSIVQMPRGIPVATVAIGNADNAALLAASILALGDPELAARVATRRRTRRPTRSSATRRTRSRCPTSRRPAAGRSGPRSGQTVRPGVRYSSAPRPRAAAGATPLGEVGRAGRRDGLEHDHHDQRPDRRPEERDRERAEHDRHVEDDDPAVGRAHLRATGVEV